MPGPPTAVVRGRVRMPSIVGLRRTRLIQPLVSEAAPQLTLVVAPPGSGKSTLLAHAAEAAAGPVAWLTLDAATVEAPAILAHLRAAFEPAVPGLRPEWPSAEAALADLEERLTGRVLLVLDDVHTADREPAAEVIRLLVRYQPPLLRLVLGSRTVPDIDMPRWRLAGSAAEVDADVLRFRTWEVEELFRECHGVPLRADEVRALTRRTGGWAAGLQLFHLATYRRPPSSRAALLAGTGSAGRLTRDYLARHVLDQIPVDLREFLVRSSVLDELTASRCDALLGTADAADRLSALDRRGLFTSVDGDAEGDGLLYRYHEVLRGHLLEELVAGLGTEEARGLHRRAAGLLREEGALGEAIRSYCRAQDWENVREVLAIGGASLAGDRGSWLDALPIAIRDSDPWVLLALARRLVADGVLDRAAETYRRAVERFAAHGGGRMAADELRLLHAWMEPAPGVVTDWVHVTRAVLVDPKEQLRTVRPTSIRHELALGFAHLTAGNLPEAAELLGAVANRPELPAAGEAAALLGRALGLTLAGAPTGAAAREESAAAAKLLGAPVLARLAHGLQAVADGDDPTVDHLVAECEQVGDRWGGALLRLMAGIAALSRDTAPATQVEPAEQEFRQLRAPALATWAAATAAAAAARAGRPYAREQLADVERAAGAVGPLPYAIALLAVAGSTADPVDAERALALGLRLAGVCGATGWARRVARRLGPAPAPFAARRQVRIRCLGGFSVELGGAAVDLEGVRPQHRALLRLLCLHADRTVHRERMLEWFWSGRDPERSQHSLQVAMSELRRLLEPDAARGEWTLLRREGSGYRLVLGAGDDCDVRRLEDHLRAAELAVRAGDETTAAGHLDAAIAAYPGELLPDDGPAEWVVAERERLRDALADACERLAALRAASDDHAEAVRIAQQGLRHDRYRDGLWQRLIESLLADGNPAAAAAARNAYGQVLAEMGVSASR